MYIFIMYIFIIYFRVTTSNLFLLLILLLLFTQDQLSLLQSSSLELLKSGSDSSRWAIAPSPGWRSRLSSAVRWMVEDPRTWPAGWASFRNQEKRRCCAIKANWLIDLVAPLNLRDPLVVFASLSDACRTRCYLFGTLWVLMTKFISMRVLGTDYLEEIWEGRSLMLHAHKHMRAHTQSTCIQLFHFCAKKIQLQYFFDLYIYIFLFFPSCPPAGVLVALEQICILGTKTPQCGYTWGQMEHPRRCLSTEVKVCPTWLSLLWTHLPRATCAVAVLFARLNISWALGQAPQGAELPVCLTRIKEEETLVWCLSVIWERGYFHPFWHHKWFLQVRELKGGASKRSKGF